MRKILYVILYLPYAIISYPSILMGDNPWQIAQAFPELKYHPSVPEWRILSENVYISMHHPVAHTLLIHACLCIGNVAFNSWNAGLYIYSILQGLVFICIISYSIAVLIKKKTITVQFAFVLVCLYFFHPQIHRNVFLASKDVIYSAFFALFIINWFLILKNEIDKKTYLLLIISIIGMILFRNEGRYVLLLSLIVSAIIYKPIRRKAGVLAVGVVLFSVFLFHVLFPSLNFISGSPREMLSVPFQQTARYITYHKEEVTEEEKAAISKVLNYDYISENYNPINADPVKNSYIERATFDDLRNYFKTWFRMFFKHPGTYIQATINNYYEYLFPSKAKLDQYIYAWSDRIMEEVNSILEPISIKLTRPSWTNGIRQVSDDCISMLKKAPFFSTLLTPAVYSWLILLFLFYGIKYKQKKVIVFMSVPVFALLICLMGPENARYSRYLHPIIVLLPVLIPMFFEITKEKVL